MYVHLKHIVSFQVSNQWKTNRNFVASMYMISGNALSFLIFLLLRDDYNSTTEASFIMYDFLFFMNKYSWYSCNSLISWLNLFKKCTEAQKRMQKMKKKSIWSRQRTWSVQARNKVMALSKKPDMVWYFLRVSAECSQNALQK